MNAPAVDVDALYGDFDSRHPDDRLRMYTALADHLDPESVLYPGSYVEIAPSVHFDDVTYVDSDRRAARFFAASDAVAALVQTKRQAVGHADRGPASIAFHHRDYTGELPLAEGSVDLLISMYAGFVSEHCTRYLRRGGHLLVNPSHGDASMAAIDPRYRLVAAVNRREGRYRIHSEHLDRFLVPRRGSPPTRSELHRLGRGVAYTRSPFAYLFRKIKS